MENMENGGTKRVSQAAFAHERRTLLRQRKKLIRRLDTLRNGCAITAEPADSAELAAAALENETCAALNSLEADCQVQIDDALEGLCVGTYGICKVCGGAISKKRLHACPDASLCLACKKEEEEAGGRVYEPTRRKEVVDDLNRENIPWFGYSHPRILRRGRRAIFKW